MENRSAAAPTSAPVVPRQKKPTTGLNELLAAVRVLSEIPKKLRDIQPLTPKQAGALINREPKTMERDRREQRAAIEEAKRKKVTVKIDPLHPRSLPYLPPSGTEREVQYIISDVLDYLERRAKAVDRSFLKRGGPGEPELRGFQSWLSFGSASDTWPFAIQADGRPVDILEAIATSRLTEDAVRLNIGEFSKRLSDAASLKTVADDKAAIAKVARKPVAAKTATNNRASRWAKPGGPI